MAKAVSEDSVGKLCSNGGVSKPTDGHQFPEVHFDPDFVEFTLQVLNRHSLIPVDRSSWNRPCWHSNYGLCLTAEEKIVFVKIFKPDFGTNAQAEVDAKARIAALASDRLYTPHILAYYPEDRCLVMEPVTGRSFSELFLGSQYDTLLESLVRILLDIRCKTLSGNTLDVQEWILGRATRYASSILNTKPSSSLARKIVGVQRQLMEPIDNLATFAFGDVTPRHLYWDQQRERVVFVDVELAGDRPDFYDVAYFCHRLATHSQGLIFDRAWKMALTFLDIMEGMLTDSESLAFRLKVMRLLGLRILGGMVDCWVIHNGSEGQRHLQALQIFLDLEY